MIKSDASAASPPAKKIIKNVGHFWGVPLSSCIKDAGIAIRHSQERILFYTAGSRNGLEGVANRVTNKLYPRKRHFFVMEKYIEDARQKEKDVPDLLEAIMRPTCLVKEELRQNLFKMNQFGPGITKIRV